jgi:hypothetical protein
MQVRYQAALRPDEAQIIENFYFDCQANRRDMQNELHKLAVVLDAVSPLERE